MTADPVSLFINPIAGRGRTNRRCARIMEIFDAAGVVTLLTSSRSVGDLEQQVRAQVDAGRSRIVVAGGDGSVHEAVNGIMRAKSPAALGVIPSGTGNDFAKACSIPLDWEQATRLLADRLAANVISLRIDIGRMNERYFANGAGIGFDAEVTRIAQSYRWPIGDLVYLLAIFRAMADGIASPDISVVADSSRWQGPVTLVTVCNGPWIGGMFHIAPMADNSDGRLELLIADPVSRLRILNLLPKLMRGQHLHEPEIRHTSVRRLSVEASAPVSSHLDGEVQPLAKAFEIEILPGALSLL